MAALKWWQKVVFYQIYPRSFADGNGDGIGDVAGMIQKLDYLKELGVEGLWLSPHYPSPQFDCGYDISDYTDVAPEYGTIEEFRTFIDEAHRCGIRVILDMVLNHTSEEHPWFIESRSSRNNPKRDWYVWQDPKPGGGPPNNWYSVFGGPAWEYDEPTDSYYYHCFFKQQPDLNWRNPQVKKAMFDAVRFWLDLGVDGYRLDAIGTIYEEAGFPDHQAGLTQDELYLKSVEAKTVADRAELEKHWWAMFGSQVDQPGIHELMRELRDLVDEYPDRVLVGETDEIAFYGSGDDELQLVFNFPLMQTDRLTPAWVRENQKKRLALLPADSWPCNTLGNHDCPRVYSYFGDGEHNDALARLHLVLLLALKGTPFLYNGEEIGMSDYLITDMSLLRDQQAIYAYHLAVDVMKLPREEALKMAVTRSRDKNRTPMQWEHAPNAGFSPQGVTTWLPVNPNYRDGVNVADQERDPNSLLSFYRRALRVRAQSPALISGDYQPLAEDSEESLVFLRSAADQRCLVALNMSGQPCTLSLDLPVEGGRLVFSTHARPSEYHPRRPLMLEPFEASIFDIR